MKRELAILLDSLRINYSIIDKDGYYIDQNRTTNKDISQGSLNAKDIEPELWEDCKRVMKSGKQENKEEIFNGRCYLSIKKPIEEGLLVLSIDITKQKQDDFAKREFVANMNQFIRNGLSGVKSLSHVLFEEEEDPSKRQLLNVLCQSADSLHDLLCEVVHLSNVLKGEEFKSGEFDPADVVRASHMLMKAEAHSKQLHYTISAEAPTIVSDKTRFNRVVSELLDNAIKFNQPGGFVHVDLHPVGSKLRLRVEDSGIGIPESRIDDIFKYLTRLNPAGYTRYEGLGNGLYIVKRYTEEMGGTVSVESKLGEGSVFECNIPFKKLNAQA